MAIDLTPNTTRAVITITGFLALASVAAYVSNRRKDNTATTFTDQVRSWWIVAMVFAVAIAVSQTASVVFLSFISFLAFKEYISLIPTRRADRSTLFWAYFAIPLQYLCVFFDWYGGFLLFIPVFVFLYLPILMALTGRTVGFLRAAGSLHWGLMTAVYSLSHVAYLLKLPGDINPKGGGAGFVIFLIVLTQLNDVFVQLWGRFLGKRKIVRQAGRHKTLEGLSFGVATTMLVALAMGPQLTPFNAWQSLLGGAIIGVAGFFGDVSVTAMKRDLRLSAGGTMLHGGVLDRVDSLTYTAPLFFHFVYQQFF